jgi:hypothetical protein
VKKVLANGGWDAFQRHLTRISLQKSIHHRDTIRDCMLLCMYHAEDVPIEEIKNTKGTNWKHVVYTFLVLSIMQDSRYVGHILKYMQQFSSGQLEQALDILWTL